MEELRKAADYLAEHGWHQGSLYSHEAALGPFPPACAIGAIRKACGGYGARRNDSLFDAAARQFNGYLTGQGVGLDGTDPPAAGWNDDPNRTAEDVILALKKAAVEDE